MPGRNKQASEWNISFHFPFQQDKYDNQTFFASTECQSIRNWTPGKLKFHVRKPNKLEVSKRQKVQPEEGCDCYSRATDLMTWVCLREQIVKCKFDYMGSYFESALLILQWCCLLSLTTKDLFINIENSKCLTYLLFIHDIHKELKVFLKHPLGLQMLNLLLSCNVL